MRGLTPPLLITVLVISTNLFSCGYSQDQWKLRADELTDVRAKLKAEQRAHAQADADYADALEEIDHLRDELRETERVQSQEELADEEQVRSLMKQEQSAQEEAGRHAQTLVDHVGERLASQMEIVADGSSILVRIPADALFVRGHAKLTSAGEKMLIKLRLALSKDETLLRRPAVLAAHSDGQPLGRSSFADDWEMTSMQARAVLLYLSEDDELKWGRVSLQGYGSSLPLTVSEDQSVEERAQNRRVELVFLAPDTPSQP